MEQDPYALSMIEQTTAKKITGASGEGLQKEYNLKNTTDTGLVLGGGWAFPLGFMSLYVQYEYISMSELKANQHAATGGLRWYF